jgi:hypothetical protein
MNTNPFKKSVYKTFEKSFIKNASLKTLRRTRKYALPIVLVLSMVLVLLCATASADTVTLRPDGPGAYTEWDKSGCTANWECVDETTPDEDLTYVYTPTVGARDLYSLTDSGLSELPETVYIKSVSNCFRGRGSGGVSYYPLIRTHDTVFEGGAGGLHGYYYNICRSHSTNPYTGERWTIAEVDALQAGIKRRSSGELRVTTVWVNVDYTFNPIEMSKPKLYDENLTETNTFVRSDTMTVRVDVIHLENATNLTDVTITIADSKDTVKVNNETMEKIADITNGYTYEYNHTIPPDAELGTWTVKVYVSDTSNNHASNENILLVRASERAGGCPSETKYHGTIHGGIYYEMGGDFGSETLTVTFDDVPAGIQIARVYTGVWGGSGGEGGRFRITVNDEPSNDYCACYNTGDEPAACNAVNEPECHDYATGCGVNFITYDATPYIRSGSNTVKMETWADSENCCSVGWDGRIYTIALLVVYGDQNMPEITYFINEGAPFMEETCGYDEAFIYFNGEAYSGSTSDMKYWTLGMPNNAGVNPELNENDIGDPEGGSQYGSGFYLWSDIQTSYLNPSSNLFYYYSPGASWERVGSAVLMLNHTEPSDLTVTDISIEGGLYADPDSTGHYANTVDATVVNNGKTAHFFDVTLYANGEVVDVKRVRNLGEGESRVVRFLWAPTQADSYLLNVTADAENIVKETNEANNAKTMSVEVTIAPPPEWQSQSSSPGAISNGGSIELRAQGKAELGLDYAVLATDETGTWTNHTNYGSPMDLASYSTDSITHTSDADWNAQIRDNVRVTDGNVMLDKHAGTVNIALNKPAYASSSQADHSPDKANEGIDSTYWASEANEYPCWWYVDLEGVKEVEKIFIDTQDAHHYAIYTSDDGTNWTWKTEEGYAKDETLTNLGWSCRYINVTIIESFDGATSGEIVEFEAYGAVYNPSGTLTSKTVATPDCPIVAVTPTWSLTKPAGTSLSVNISVDDGAAWTSASNGEELTWDYDVHNTKLKYKVAFATTDVTQTPVLHDITLNYKTRDPIESEWLWSNFTWHNPSIMDKTVSWKIYYEDMLGKTNCTEVMSFDVGTPGPDTTGPETTNVVANPNPTNGANTVTLTANVDDSTTGNSIIAAAEYFVDTVGGDGTGTAMSASDAAFDSITEGVTADIDVSGWAVGNYTLYVHGKDAAGNWGGTESVVLEVTEAGGEVEDKAKEDIPVKGDVTGSYLDTHTSDDVCESITEVLSGGKKADRYSYLEHKWSIDVTGDSDFVFYLEAHHSQSNDGDHFEFAYSKDDNTYTPMLTVTKTTDDGTYQTYTFTEQITGTVYIRVQDTDRNKGHQELNTVYIDHMYIKSKSGSPSYGVTVTIDEASQTVKPGESTTYTVRVKNTGGLEASYSVVMTGTAVDESTITVNPLDWNTGTLAQNAEDIKTVTVSTTSGTPETTYTLTATATCAQDASVTDSATSDLVVSSVTNAMHIYSIDMTLKTAGPNTNAVAKVTIVDANGVAVEGAAVSGTWSGATSDPDSDTTDASGQVSLSSDKVKNPPGGTTFTFTVDGVVLTGWIYDSAANVETSDSISV